MEMDPSEVWTGEDDDVQTYVEHLRDREPMLYQGMLDQSQRFGSAHEQTEAMREMALEAASTEVGED